MALAPGLLVGPYEVLSHLGEGGMGVVYRARDTRLKREVALKTLPEAVAADPDRLARFQREAEVLAALNHPHIAQIYGLEDATGADGRPLTAIAMELVEGDTLADRIARGALSLDEALPLVRQIAEALEAAHEKGVVHRDLKPANIKLTPSGSVKVLDFGLAKAMDPTERGTSAGLTLAPTMTSPAMTQAGVILGTAAYMSPEQARGKPVDKRADIWAFGCVLYEMVTGAAPFGGETVTDVLAAVVAKEPDQARVPPRLRRLIGNCLQKDPRQRLRDVGDAWQLLEASEPAAGTLPAVAGRSSWRRVAPWGLAGLFGVLAAAVTLVHLREPRSRAAGAVRFQIQVALEAGASRPAMSPDGRHIVYQTSKGISVHDLDSVEPRLIATTDNPVATPFWSADSRSIVYATSSKLMQVDVAGGPPRSISDFAGVLTGGLWTPDDRLLVLASGDAQTMPVRGGALQPLRAGLRRTMRLASGGPVLPDGRRFVYSGAGADGEAGIFVANLDGTGQPVRLLSERNDDVAVVVSPDGSGHLLFARQGSLMVQPFDLARGEVSGEAVSLVTGVGRFSASATGDLAYTAATDGRHLTWFDRQGNRTGTAWAPGPYNELSLSPDGSQVAVVRANNAATWIYDFAREASRRLVELPTGGSSVKPTWSPDGSAVAFVWAAGGQFKLYSSSAAGGSSPSTLFESATLKYPASWSRDGRWLLFTNVDSTTREDLWTLPMSGPGPRTPEPFLVTDAAQTDGAFSPDGRFVAYVSNETGVAEVYVRAFPAGASGKWTISSGGGYQPRWRSDGRELFYISGKSELMSVDVKTGEGFSTSSPRRLFPLPIYGGGASVNNRYWDVMPDGQRFLVVTGENAGTTTLNVLLNWPATLRSTAETR